MATPTGVQHVIPKHGTGPSANGVEGARHPLDPLSAAELEEAVRILARAGRMEGDVRIASLTLAEPAKKLVEQHKTGSAV